TALFKLGNIYNQQLKEAARAAETFEKLLARNPQTKYAAETYYNLYLLYTQLDDPKAATYSAKLRSEFPNSTFVRIIDQPDYLARNAAASLKVKQLYDSAFTLFEKEKYKEAASLSASIRKDNPQTDINDKLDFLNLLILGKTAKPEVYKDAAVRFVFDYPRSQLNPRAQAILKAIKDFESGKLNYIAPPA